MYNPGKQTQGVFYNVRQALENVEKGNSLVLSLKLNDIDRDEFKTLIILLQKSSSLINLALKSSVLQPDSIQKLAEVISDHTGLHSLNFEECTFAAEDGVKQLASGLGDNKYLEKFKLTLHGNEEDIIELIQELRKQGNIRELILKNCPLNEKAINALADFIKDSSKLERISLQSSITESDFMPVKDAYYSNKQILIEWDFEDFEINNAELLDEIQSITNERKSQQALIPNGIFSHKNPTNGESNIHQPLTNQPH